MPAVIPALTEDEASGQTAALFADIRLALGVPVVNLIWRHLATFPGGLDWAWGAVRPLYRSGVAEREGATLLAALLLPPPAAWSRKALDAAGLDEAAERTVVTVLDSYNRSNAMNLVALTALGLRLQEPLAPAGTAARVVPAGERLTAEGQMPVLLTLAQMAPTTAQMVRKLDRLGERGDGRIPASMYRHLAHWPGFLALALGLITPLDHEGRLGELIDTARDLAHAAAQRVAGDLAAPRPAPGPATQDAVQAALAAFTSGVIAKMVPICALLRGALPA